LTGQGDREVDMEAMKAGAQDYLNKNNMNSTSLERSIRYAFERHKRKLKRSISYAIERRKLAAQLNEAQRLKTGKVLGFIGAKGGVGTTTVVLNVASALAKNDKNVIAVEFRSDFGKFSLQMNKAPVENMEDLPEFSPGRVDRRELNRRLIKTKFGFSALVCPQSDQAGAVIKGLESMADYTVIDLPSHSLTYNEAVLRQCNFVALVVEPNLICLKTGKVMLERLISWGVGEGQVGVVVVYRTRLQSQVSLDSIKTQLGCDIVGVVPPADDLMVAQETGTPIALLNSASLFAHILSEVADRLAADTPSAMKL